MLLKDRLYEYFVRKNGRVWYEYERYVREHMEEYHLNRFSRLKVLFKLNWFYRIKKGNTPYLYWDVPLDPKKVSQKENEIISNINTVNKKSVKMPYRGIESTIGNVRGPQHLVKKLMQYDVISFDVFDTLVFRPIAPKDVFKILEERNGIQHFALLRVKTEEELRKIEYDNTGTREITLFQIYSEIERKTGLNIELGMASEIEIEKQLCFANDYMKKVFNMLMVVGKHIIISSDMYLPESVITDILHKNGYKGFEKIYVSGDLKKSKAVGDLYDYIKNDYKELTIAHIGDNKHSDIKMCEERGIDAFYYPNVNDVGNPYRADGISAIFNSAYACIVNSKIHSGVDAFSAKYEYGYIYGGLYVLGYVNWIHNFAVEHNLDKIIFLARDGEIYKKVYDSLYSDIKSEYLLCSRSVIVRSSIKNNRYDFLRRFIFYRALNKQDYTVFDLCKDIGLLDQIEEIKRYYNYRNDTRITMKNYEMLTNFVISKIELVENYLERETNALKAYVVSIVGNANKVALVDVGWAGSGPKNLKMLIEEEWGLECKVYGLLAGQITDIPSKDIYYYSFSNRHNRNHYDTHAGNKRVNVNNDLFELFTQSCAPSIKRIYFDGKNNVKFEFASPSVEGYESIKEIHQGIYDFAMDYTEKLKYVPFLHSITGYDAYLPFRLVKRDIAYFKEILGDLPIETDTGGSQSEPMYLRKYLEREIK